MGTEGRRPLAMQRTTCGKTCSQARVLTGKATARDLRGFEKTHEDMWAVRGKESAIANQGTSTLYDTWQGD